VSRCEVVVVECACRTEVYCVTITFGGFDWKSRFGEDTG
jgi:hypothetical protein